MKGPFLIEHGPTWTVSDEFATLFVLEIPGNK